MADNNNNPANPQNENPNPNLNPEEQQALRLRRLAERRRDALLADRERRRGKSGIRFRQYATCSLSFASLLLYWAFATRRQFYPAVVYLTSSKIAYVTAGNAAVCLTVLCFRLLTHVLLAGGLRDVEREAVSDGLRWGLMETCLAMTIFREEVTVHMVVMFLALSLGKCLHWSVELRGGHLQQADAVAALAVGDDEDEDAEDSEDDASVQNDNDNDNDNAQQPQPPPPPRQTPRTHQKNQRLKRHLGFLLLTLLLLLADFLSVVHCATTCAQHGPSVHILFGFEAAILLISASSTLSVYTLHLLDKWLYASRDAPFHHKGTLLLAVELATESCRFLFYVVFFTIVFTYYGMPLNVIRDLWVSYNRLKSKLSSFARYRKLTSNMQERFEDASEKDLEDCGFVCIICRDAMASSEGGVMGGGGGARHKKLPCGHVFHFYCLREWLQQQQTCPTCRANIPADGKKARRRREEAERRMERERERAGEDEEEEEKKNGDGDDEKGNEDSQGKAKDAEAKETETGTATTTRSRSAPFNTAVHQQTTAEDESTQKKTTASTTTNKPTKEAQERAKRAEAAAKRAAAAAAASASTAVPPEAVGMHMVASALPSPPAVAVQDKNDNDNYNYNAPARHEEENVEEEESEEESQEEQEENDSPFPCFYRVTSPHGAPVYQDTAHTNTNTNVVNGRNVLRTVPSKKLILCTEIQWKLLSLSTPGQAAKNENEEEEEVGTMMVKMPDGWVKEADVARIPISLSNHIMPC